MSSKQNSAFDVILRSLCHPQLQPPPPKSVISMANVLPSNVSTSASSTYSSTLVDAARLVDLLVYIYFMPVVCALGVVLNALNVALYSQRRFVGLPYTLMCALAAADLVTLALTSISGFCRCALPITIAPSIFEVRALWPCPSRFSLTPRLSQKNFCIKRIIRRKTVIEEPVARSELISLSRAFSGDLDDALGRFNYCDPHRRQPAVNIHQRRQI